MECIRQVGVGKILKSLETTAKSYEQELRARNGMNENMGRSDVHGYRIESGNEVYGLRGKNVGEMRVTANRTEVDIN